MTLVWSTIVDDFVVDQISHSTLAKNLWKSESHTITRAPITIFEVYFLIRLQLVIVIVGGTVLAGHEGGSCMFNDASSIQQ